MKFHLPSFAIGYAAGFGTAVLKPKLKKVFIELATVGYRIVDSVGGRATRKREDLEDMLAEARARATSQLNIESKS